MFTLYRIALAPARKSFQTGCLFTHKNRDFAISRDILFCAFQVQLEFRSVYNCFLVEEKNGVPREKPLV